MTYLDTLENARPSATADAEVRPLFAAALSAQAGAADVLEAAGPAFGPDAWGRRFDWRSAAAELRRSVSLRVLLDIRASVSSAENRGRNATLRRLLSAPATNALDCAIDALHAAITAELERSYTASARHAAATQRAYAEGLARSRDPQKRAAYEEAMAIAVRMERELA